MNNVRPFNSYPGSFPVNSEEPASDDRKPHVPTTAQLKRTAAVLRRAIAKEERRQRAAREVDRLQRKLDDTFAAKDQDQSPRY